LSKPHVSIIILNWNGWRDTIECLESIYKSVYENFHILLIDNNSNDNSTKKILGWASGSYEIKLYTDFKQLVYPLVKKPLPVLELNDVDESSIKENIKIRFKNNLPLKSIILFNSIKNMGFAAGNNLAIKIDNILFNSPYVYILNNDTIIEPNSITNLISFMEKNQIYGAVSSAIYFYSNPEKIHNVGGKLSILGYRKYYNDEKQIKNKEVTFATGCALLIRKNVFRDSHIFSEKFFFGEEDFELALRMRKQNIPLTCLGNSKIYHKISHSSNNLFSDDLRKKFLYFFLRSINLKDYYPKLIWFCWNKMIGLYAFFWLMIKYKVPVNKIIRFIIYLDHYGKIYDDAKKLTIERIYREIDF